MDAHRERREARARKRASSFDDAADVDDVSLPTSGDGHCPPAGESRSAHHLPAPRRHPGTGIGTQARRQPALCPPPFRPPPPPPPPPLESARARTRTRTPPPTPLRCSVPGLMHCPADRPETLSSLPIPPARPSKHPGRRLHRRPKEAKTTARRGPCPCPTPIRTAASRGGAQKAPCLPSLSSGPIRRIASPPPPPLSALTTP